MLKTFALSGKLNSNKLEVDDGEGGNGVGGVKIAKKLGKLKSQKLSKSQKLAKSKKLLKSRFSPNFDAKNSGPSFLTPKARATFNRLRLAFPKP